MTFYYDVALSFAGEDRHVVEPIAHELREIGLRVFYDKYEETYLWGKDLYQHLDRIYREQARFCVIFVSRSYREKVWTKHELKSAQARAIADRSEYILPARLDDTAIPGILPTVAYINVADRPARDVAQLIAGKISTYGDRLEPPDVATTARSAASAEGGYDGAPELSEIRRELDRLRRITASRELAPSAVATLLNGLRDVSREKIGVFSPETDEEAQDYAASIASVFMKAGWLIENGTAVYSATIIGVEVVALTGVGYPALLIPPIANQLAEVLGRAGITATVNSLREMPGEYRVFIAVGQKPRAAPNY